METWVSRLPWAVARWQRQSQAEAFLQQGLGAQWQQTLTEYGHQLELRDAGDVIEDRTARMSDPEG